MYPTLLKKQNKKPQNNMCLFNRKLKERISILEANDAKKKDELDKMKDELDKMKDEIFGLTNRPKFREFGKSNTWYISKRSIQREPKREWRYTLQELTTGKCLEDLNEEEAEKLLKPKKIISFN